MTSEPTQWAKEQRLIAQLIDGGDADLADYEPSERSWLIAEDIINVFKPHLDAARAEALEEAARLADSEAADYGALYVLEGFPEDLERKGACERLGRRLIRRALVAPQPVKE